jgi:uncharacterized protein HemY
MLAMAAAEDRYHLGLVRAEALGMRPLIAHCHRGLGQLYRRTGRWQDAQEHLATGTRMYREMGMRFWLEEVDTRHPH